MEKTNLQRLLEIVDETFDVKNDPNQLEVNQDVIARLQKMHPCSMTELTNENGPIAWALLIPTTNELMYRFLLKEISEKQLFELTPDNSKFESVYLCSAIVLPEFRRKGLIKIVLSDAINEMRKDHPISSLFVWAFTEEGDLAAEKIAELVGLQLFKRKD
jgi:hypothetical protein